MSKEPDIVEVLALRPMLQEFNEELGHHINEAERYKLGRMLTIIDASFTDQEQRKAVKDLVQNEWWARSNGPINSKMVNPHTDLRAIAKALGFELYPPGESQPLIAVPPRTEEAWFESGAVERYKRLITE